MLNQIEIINMNKSFKKKEVLKDVNISFSSGEIIGLVGPNGSGKSVFLKLLSGLLNLTSGTIKYNGKIIGRKDINKINFGVSIEKPQFIEDLTANENLVFLASFRKLITQETINEWLKIFDLYEVKNKKVREFSLGMKQKLAIIQALMENPSIILLDEVSNSLDNESKKILFSIIEQEKKAGKIIIYVNHNFDEVSRVADRIFEIKNMELVVCENLD